MTQRVIRGEFLLEGEVEKCRSDAIRQQVLVHIAEILMQRGLISREEEMAMKELIYTQKQKNLPLRID